VDVGDIEITAVHDGRFNVPATAFFPSTSDVDWAPHKAFLNDDGTLPLELGGFLVRSHDRVLLVDAGVGPRQEPGFGRLLASLAELGVAPDDVTDVVFTHLHFDHVGWASAEGTAVFSRATYRCDARDWDFFSGPDAAEHERTAQTYFGAITAREKLAPVLDRIETWRGDTVLAPGVEVRSAPGHTPGSAVVVLSSGTERALLLGDVVHCPVELLEDEWAALGDVDPKVAARTRATWVAELEGSGVAAAAAHFPGMRFGRLLPASGRRQWVFS
jgi:glyoxylase-like metal-dependent hydrolase (beta-lactamase superfamily II)